MKYEELNLDSILKPIDFSSIGQPCVAEKDIIIAEEINRKMQDVSQSYFSMSEKSYRLSSGLHLRRYILSIY